MQKSIFPATLVVVILLTLAIGPAPAANAQANPETAASTPNPAKLPWKIGWVDNGTSASVGENPSVAYSPIDGLPYITYYDAFNGHLMLASPGWKGGLNCGTHNDWWCRVVDGDGGNGSSLDNVGTYSSIAFWKGLQGSTPVWKLGIAYHDVTHHGQKYAVFTQYPSSWSWDFQTISSTNVEGADQGLYNSLKFTSDGLPIIASHTITTISSYLNISRWVGSGGNCGEGPDLNAWRCDIVDHGPGIGTFASLDIDLGGKIGIAYYDEGNGNLKYARYIGTYAANCGIPYEYACETVDGATADVGRSAALYLPHAVNEGYHIAYYDRTNGKLKYAFRTTTNSNCGSGLWWCGNVDSIGADMAQVGISITLDNKGDPIFAYEDAAEELGPSTLNIARPAHALDLGWGNCGDTLPGYLFTYWQCNTLDTAGYGQGYVTLARYTSVAVNASGLATIAYFERDDYYNTDSLKYATQFTRTFLPLVRR